MINVTAGQNSIIFPEYEKILTICNNSYILAIITHISQYDANQLKTIVVN